MLNGEERTAEEKRMDVGEGFEVIRPVPQMRVREKLDEYMAKRDYPGAEKHLRYWLAEALLGRDRRGELMVRGELVGHCRKTGEKEKALEQVDAVLRLLEDKDVAGDVGEGTACVNCATALNAFGENDRAMALFERARRAYERGGADDRLLGGLYNNMGLCCAALGRYEEAYGLYDRAMERMAQVPGGELERAVTCLNRADAAAAWKGMEAAEKEIDALLTQAKDLLDAPNVPRDGYYAFVCEKCAPGFAYYGWFLDARELRERAESIYDRA